MNIWDMLHNNARRCHYVTWLPSLEGYIGYTQIGPCSYIKEYTFHTGNGIKSVCFSTYTINPAVARCIRLVNAAR